MNDLSLLGNAAAVPVIMAITQALKKNFKFKRRSDTITLAVSVLVCFGWSFYVATDVELMRQWAAGPVVAAKSAIELLIISFATWLSASKSYDLFIGEKKRGKTLEGHLEENQALKKKIEVLKNGNEKKEAVVEKNSSEDSKLRSILEGR